MVSVMRLVSLGEWLPWMGGGKNVPRCNRSNDVRDNIVLGALLGQSFGEAYHSEFGGRIICLAERSVETSGGGGVDDSAILLLSEDRPACLGSLDSWKGKV